MSKRPTSSIPSLSPSYITKREQHIFKDCALLIPWILKKANMESNTLQRLTDFFSAKVVIFGKCSNIALWKNVIIKKYNSKKRNFRYSAAFPVEGRLKLPPDAATIWMKELQLEDFIYAALRVTWKSNYEIKYFQNTEVSTVGTEEK